MNTRKDFEYLMRTLDLNEDGVLGYATELLNKASKTVLGGDRLGGIVLSFASCHILHMLETYLEEQKTMPDA